MSFLKYVPVHAPVVTRPVAGLGGGFGRLIYSRAYQLAPEMPVIWFLGAMGIPNGASLYVNWSARQDSGGDRVSWFTTIHYSPRYGGEHAMVRQYLTFKKGWTKYTKCHDRHVHQSLAGALPRLAGPVLSVITLGPG